jgi:cytochrome c-type biogenesis protein CcmE
MATSSNMATKTSRIMRFGAAIVIIVLTLSYLAYTGVEASKSYYVTISEMNGMGDKAHTRRLRVAGTVVTGSIKRNGTTAEFLLEENGMKLPVIYKGAETPPDTFKDESQALVEGSLGNDGVFHANMLQAKCASKYAPKKDQAPGMNAQPATDKKS